MGGHPAVHAIMHMHNYAGADAIKSINQHARKCPTEPETVDMIIN